MSNSQQIVIALQITGNDNNHSKQYSKQYSKQFIVELCERLSNFGRTIFLRKTAELDVDSKGKDSDVLFSAGLDYLFLVSDVKQYAKAQQPFLDNIDLSAYRFVVEETNHLPPTHYLQLGDEFSTPTANTFFVKINKEVGNQAQTKQIDDFINFLGEG